MNIIENEYYNDSEYNTIIQFKSVFTILEFHTKKV